MANNLIQMKRSNTTSVPASLAYGEIAFTTNGNVLFIGNNSGVVPIGGLRVPGTLTANQALVANATSAIDKIITANLVPTQIYANGTVGSAGQVLVSANAGNVYWTTLAPSVVGTNSQVQFNDDGALGADDGFTYDKSANALFVEGIINTASFQVGSFFVANTSKVTIADTVGLQANGSVGTNGQMLTSNGSTIYWSSPTLGTVTSVASGNGISGGPITSSGTLSVVANNGLAVNSSGVFAVSSNGIAVDSNGIRVAPGSTITVNSTGVHVNNQLSITDLSLSGNLTVSGTLTTVDTNSLVVKDSMIKLAELNENADVLDIGFYGMYGNDTVTSYSGLFRDATDGIYKLFNTQAEPTSTIDTANATYSLLNLQVNTVTMSYALSPSNGGTGQNTYATGDILYSGSVNPTSLSKLSIGSDGHILQVNASSGAPYWGPLDGGVF